MKGDPPGTTELWKLEAAGAASAAAVTKCNPAKIMAQLRAYHQLKGMGPNFKVRADPDFRVQTFFGAKTRNECDLKDEHKKSLFESALHTLGPLSSTEMYGFEPALVAGGRMALEHLKKVNLDVHLTILRQLAPPKIPFAGAKL